MKRQLVPIGTKLLILGGAGYVAGFFYGLKFAYSEVSGPAWLNILFPVSIGLVVAGFLILMIGLSFGRGQPKL